MALLRLCTMFILLELQHCHPTDQAEKSPEVTCCNPGVPGTPGHNGLPGNPGHNGLNGKDGKEGVAGKDGKEGMAGQKGEMGERGLMGAQGPPGKFGPAGPVGPTGAPGPVGPAGPKGLMGPVGPSGPKGEKGERGPAGPLPAINLVELQSELQTLKDVFNVFKKVLQFDRKRVGRKVFVTNKKTGKFDEAVKLCSLYGGVPALPTSLEENQALSGLLSVHENAWLSANDRKTEGKFVDLQEKVIQFSSWKNGEPNDWHGQEDCAIILSNGEWNDYTCEESTFIIVCEI